MNAGSLKERLREQLWQVVDRHEFVLSATVTGSFVESESLEGISDIDLVLIVDSLNAARYQELLDAFATHLELVLREAGYSLRINPTLGPLKFNDAHTAVLHLMLYSRQAHVEHVVSSPFTCYDWQRSPWYRKRALAEIYPVFGLQPRHFLGARRSLSDYLRDLRLNAVSYRELVCSPDGYREERRSKPMSQRDRHEFAYHVMRFLMQNLLKLVSGQPAAPRGQALLGAFLEVFPDDREEVAPFYQELEHRKKTLDFAGAVPGLERRLQSFLACFETQFRRVFLDGATRHVVFRHAPTAMNGAAGDQRIFLGRGDPPILRQEPGRWQQLGALLAELQPQSVYSSPMGRCRQSMEEIARTIAIPSAQPEERLHEVNYGALDGMCVSDARQAHPELFVAWSRGEDPRFPGGENQQALSDRVQEFARDVWARARGNSATCTHQGVIRCLLGQVLHVPPSLWHRLQVPHLEPITFIQTGRHGLFVDLPEDVERRLFEDFAHPSEVESCK